MEKREEQVEKGIDREILVMEEIQQDKERLWQNIRPKDFSWTFSIFWILKVWEHTWNTWCTFQVLNG